MSKEKEYDNSLRGVLFKNAQKKKESHPDFKGSCEDANGNQFWLSGWKKESKAGDNYISLSLTPKEDEEEEPEIPNKKQQAKAKAKAKNKNEDLLD